MSNLLASDLAGVFLEVVNQLKCSNDASVSITIFVVDDEPLLLELATAVLQPLGYEVRTFLDPQTALTELPATKPVLLLTDYKMGKMSGLDLIRESRHLDPKQKIILLSGTVDEFIYADSATKPDVFLNKPYQVEDLVESVQKLVAN